ncbi:MAG: hypothetical protein GY696_12575 [Gammaproteobacteria bacterium]|nr:hypothetical protein [Gammaproteobacteria bacterium]
MSIILRQSKNQSGVSLPSFSVLQSGRLLSCPTRKTQRKKNKPPEEMKLRSAGQEQVLKLLLLLIYVPLAPYNAHAQDVITRISGRMKDAGQSLQGMMY